MGREQEGQEILAVGGKGMWLGRVVGLDDREYNTTRCHGQFVDPPYTLRAGDAWECRSVCTWLLLTLFTHIYISAERKEVRLVRHWEGGGEWIGVGSGNCS